jgi:hypothetical protein
LKDAVNDPDPQQPLYACVPEKVRSPVDLVKVPVPVWVDWKVSASPVQGVKFNAAVLDPVHAS